MKNLPILAGLLGLVLSSCQPNGNSVSVDCCEQGLSYFQENPYNLLSDSLAACLYAQDFDRLENRSGSASATCFFVRAFQESVKGELEQSNASCKIAERLFLSRSLSAEEEKRLADVYNLMGINYGNLLDLDQSIFYSQKAEQLYRKRALWEEMAKEMINRSVAYFTLGYVEEARREADQAASFIQEHELFSEDLVAQLNFKSNRANIQTLEAQRQWETGNLALARSTFQETIQQKLEVVNMLSGLDTTNGNVQIYLATTLMNTCASYLGHQSPAKAVAAVSYGIRARQLYERFPENAYAAEAHYAGIMLAAALSVQGKNEESISRLLPALQNLGFPLTRLEDLGKVQPGQIVRARFLISGINNLGGILHRSYKTSGNVLHLKYALLAKKTAIRFLDRLRIEQATEESRQALRSGIWGVYGEAVNIALQLWEKTGQTEYLEEAFSLSEQSKSFTLRLALQRQQSETLYSGEQQNLFRRETAFQKQFIDLEARLAAAGLEEQEQILEELGQVRKAYEAFIQKLQESTSAEARAYYQERFQVEPAAVADIQQQLPDKRTAVLEYTMSGVFGVCFALTKGQFKAVRISTKNGEWDALVQKLARATGPDGGGKAYAPAAHRLYELILKPVLAALPPEIDRLVIVPDGSLSQLAFDKLLMEPLQEKPHWVLDDYAVSYAFSVNQAQVSLLNRRPPASKALGVFLARYGGASSDELAEQQVYRCTDRPLERMAEAARALKPLFRRQGRQVEIREAATEEDFRKWAGNYRMLHFSAHGCLEELNPLNNALLFSTDPRDWSANVLTAGEIRGLDLRATRLAVLGSCNTGSGVFRPGEGMASLAWAFTYAGCPALLASTNRTPEVATAEILGHFYGFALKGLPLDKALQAAKKRYLRDHPDAHPKQWSNLVLIGSSEPVF